MRSVSIIRDGGTTRPIRERQGLSTVFLSLISCPFLSASSNNNAPSKVEWNLVFFPPAERSTWKEEGYFWPSDPVSFSPSFFAVLNVRGYNFASGRKQIFYLLYEVCTYLAMHCAKYGGGGVQVFFPGEEIHFSRRCSLSQKYNNFATRIYFLKN